MTRKATLLALALLCALVTTAPAGAAEAERLRVVARDASDYPRVSVTVAAPRQLAGEDLAGSFQLREGGEARVVDAVPVEGDALEVALVIDTSGSMAGSAMVAAQEAAASFVRQMPPAVNLAVVGFGDQPEVASEFGSTTRAAVRAIEKLEATGETSLYDAIEMAMAQFSRGDGTIRTIVLLSDGADTVSQATLPDVRVNLRRAGTAFHAIQLNTSDTKDGALRSLAEAAGGSVLSADDPGALGAVYDVVARDVTNQYVLTYESTSHGDTAVRIALPRLRTIAPATTTVQLPAAPPAPVAVPSAAPAPRPAPDVRALPWHLALLETPWSLRIAGLAVFLGAAYLALLLLTRKSRAARAPGLSGLIQQRNHAHAVADVSDWAKSRVDEVLRRRGYTERLNSRLEQAGVLLRPAEFILFVVAAGGVLFIVGTVLQSSSTGFLFALLTPLLAALFLKIKTSRRRKAFGEQLGDTLQMMAGSLRSGYGLLQAADSVAKEADSPTADEFRRLVMETRLGRDIEETLHAMGERVGSDDFMWVMQAIEIHRDVGGDLAVVLDEVGETIREREQVFRQVRSLSAEGRLSAVILLALPFVVVGGISVTNPSYMDEMFTTAVGKQLIAVGFVLMTIGALWIRKIVEPKF